MQVPRSTFVAFEKIIRSQLVRDKTVTDDSLKYFQDWLNKAQPTDDDGMVKQKVVKALFNVNKIGFINMIRRTTNERLILWTDAKSIAYFFNLNNIAYIKWNRDTRDYTVTPFVSRQNEQDTDGVKQATAIHPIVKKKSSVNKPTEGDDDDNEDASSRSVKWGGD